MNTVIAFDKGERFLILIRLDSLVLYIGSRTRIDQSTWDQYNRHVPTVERTTIILDYYNLENIDTSYNQWGTRP